MATNLSLLLSIILLLLVTEPIRGHSFKSLQHLEGSHNGKTVKGLHEIKRYLSAFGYLKLNHNIGLSSDHASVKDKDEFDEHLERAIKSFQMNFHLNVTGRLDSSTLDVMMTPRNGVSDIDDNMSPNYAFYPGKPKWDKKFLTYNFDSSVTPEVLDKLSFAMQTGFEEWHKHTQFTFARGRPSSTSDIVIGIKHLDGPGNLLALSSPPTGGFLCFDADENWSINDKPNADQTDMVSVATHEIGHIIGLQHSTHPDAVMYPFLDAGATRRNLSHDDIDGVFALYGRP
ncbi:metalloendoproteinase 5-MMP-like [Castanea sativa]|uniref:metalloendoproteinase 5-MMP-like n=1 Tax=Castanea sativa TaxID=21020 RepID=UPI003F64D7D9